MVNNKIGDLLNVIKVSRLRILEELEKLTPNQGSTKVESNGWNIQEVVEHLVLAERGGFDLIYTAAEKFRMGEPIWTGKSNNEGLSIEEIIMNTWKPKEKAPESATPAGKWSLGVWLSHFQNCDDLLKNLNVVVKDLPLNKVIYPHFLCGPLDVIQRLEFIRFHIDRHHLQIKEIKKGIGLRS
jgi:hypothetical protein